MEAKRKALGNVNLNILNDASGTRKRYNNKEEDTIPKKLCKTEIKNYLEQSMVKTRSKSASYLNKEHNIEVFEQEIADTTEEKNKELKKDEGNVKTVNILNYESAARKRCIDNKEEKISNLCKTEMKNILELSGVKTRSKSASCLNKENNIEVFNQEIADNIEERKKELKKDEGNVKKTAKQIRTGIRRAPKKISGAGKTKSESSFDELVQKGANKDKGAFKQTEKEKPSRSGIRKAPKILNNDEIMLKSTVFDDFETPKNVESPSTCVLIDDSPLDIPKVTKKPSNSESLFDKLVQEGENNHKAEENTASFKQTEKEAVGKRSQRLLQHPDIGKQLDEKARPKSDSCLEVAFKLEGCDSKISGKEKMNTQRAKAKKIIIKTPAPKRSKVTLSDEETKNKNDWITALQGRVESATTNKTCLDSTPKDSNILENNDEAEPHISNPVLPAGAFKRVSFDLVELKKISTPKEKKEKQPKEPKIPKIRKNKGKKTYPQGDIFDEDISEDIIKSAFDQEKLMLLPYDNFRQYYRKPIIKLMLSIKKTFMINHSEIYLAISLLDQVLSKMHVLNNIHQLVGLACLWISNKFVGHDEVMALYDDGLRINCVKIPDLKYNNSDLLDMESKILKLIDFRIPSLEPSFFIYYFLKTMNFDYPLLIYLEDVFDIMDVAVLLDNYSATPLSLLAAASIILAFKIYHKPHLEKVISFFEENLIPVEVLDCIIIQKSIVTEMYVPELNL